MIEKPLLAGKVSNEQDIKFPVLATPKIDGHRAYRKDDNLLSRSGKPIRNTTIRRILIELLPNGADGEIVAGEDFQDVGKAVGTSIGSAYYTDTFKFYWFDYVTNPHLPYFERMHQMEQYIQTHQKILSHEQCTIVPLIPNLMDNLNQLNAYEEKCLAEGYEGVMIRNLKGAYKFGRSTMKDGILLKIKRFVDDEAIIIGLEEAIINTNEAFKSELGYAKRSSKKDGLVNANKLGKFVVKKDNMIFKIGTGFTDAQRREFWEKGDALIGQLVTFKYFPVGIKELPRHPVFLKFRHPDDL
jgi:DNA ligase 1